MRTSDNISDLASALSAAQGEFGNPERNREVRVATKAGGEYSFCYSTLDCVMDMARPVLAKHGLSITQPPTVRDGNVIVLTRLMHSSGQWQEEEIPVVPESFSAQSIGSAITYLKRYAYCGMLGIASDEDDDGNGASGNQVTGTKSREPLPNCPKCGAQGFKDKEVEGKFFCWKTKGGCGHNWMKLADGAPAQDATPKANGHKPPASTDILEDAFSDIATTQDANDPKKAASIYSEISAKIVNAHTPDDLKRANQLMIEAHGNKTIKETQYKALERMSEKREAALKQPA